MIITYDLDGVIKVIANKDVLNHSVFFITIIQLIMIS